MKKMLIIFSIHLLITNKKAGRALKCFWIYVEIWLINEQEKEGLVTK